MNLKDTKQSLAECHIQKNVLFDILKDAGPEYLLNRVEEELK